MQPTISRETVLVDRRQSVLRWSAVFAGAACSIGFWILLQLIGVGIGLAAIDVNDIDSLRGVGIGTTVWSLISPMIAMFFGAIVAGRLAQTYDRKLAGCHGLVMWALTSIVGLCVTIWIISTVAAGATHGVLFGPDYPAAWAGDQSDQRAALDAADAAGKALTTVGFSLLLSLLTAVLGAMVALRRPRRTGESGPRRGTRTTEPGYTAPNEPMTTAPYPTPMTGPATPVVPPSDRTP